MAENVYFVFANQGRRITEEVLRLCGQAACTRNLTDSLLGHSMAGELLEAMVTTLNGRGVDLPLKHATLSAMVELSRWPQHRGMLLGAIDGLSPDFEEVLTGMEPKLSHSGDYIMGGGSSGGPLHELLLQLLIRLCNYHLRTADLLEFLNQSMDRCVILVATVLESVAGRNAGSAASPGEDAMAANLFVLLEGFTQPNAYFESEEIKQLQSVAPVKYQLQGTGKHVISPHLLSEFTEKVDALAGCCQRTGIISTVHTVLQERLRLAKDQARSLSPLEHIMVQSCCAFLSNQLSYTSGHTGSSLQMYILSSSALGPEVVVAYAESCALEIERAVDSLGGGRKAFQELHSLLTTVRRGLAGALRLLILLSFRLPALCTPLKENVLLSTEVLNYLANEPGVLVKLLNFIVNVDALNPMAETSEVPPLGWYCAEDSEGEGDDICMEALRLRSRLKTIPKELSSTQLVDLRMRLMRPDWDINPVARDVPSYQAVLDVLFNMEEMIGSSGQEADEIERMEEELLNQSADLEATRDELESLRVDMDMILRTAEAAENGKAAVPALPLLGPTESNTLPEVPTARRRDYLVTPRAINPARPPTMAPPHPQQKQPDASVLVQSLNDPIVGNLDAPPSSKNIMSPSKVPAPDGSTQAPKELCCAINGHVMKHPVRSPEGVVYERRTIELWLRQTGSVCPIRHTPLTADMLVEDKDLENRIIEWRIVSALQTNAEEDDLYDF